MAERLSLLGSHYCTSLTPVQLVEQGYCDPVRLFVKQEPHTLKKMTEGRYRLISSVSLVDQLVERMLFGNQNKIEAQLWDTIPSKPGMGLSTKDQHSKIWNNVHFGHWVKPAAEADISGFDWSVQDWELWADCTMRIQLGGFDGLLKMATINRFHCLMNSVFQLSNGELFSQDLPGLMKSGSYCTSSTNSRIRCLMAELIGSPWCIAMGDDSVEGYVPDAKDKYFALGHVCKDYVPCETNPDGSLKSFNFCSHWVSRDRTWLTSWPKTLFRFLSSPLEIYDDVEFELESNPEWNRIRKYLESQGRRGTKYAKEESEDQQKAWREYVERQNSGARHFPNH